MRAPPLLSLTVVLAAGCGTPSSLEPSSLGGVDGAPQAPTPTALATVVVADTSEVVAGATATTHCYVSDGSQRFLPDSSFTAEVVPTPASVEVAGTAIRFTPTVVGSYQVRCRVAGSVGADPAVVNVRPGPAHSLEVQLEARACYPEHTRLPVVVTVRDAWGNAGGAGAVATFAPAAGTGGDLASGLRVDREGDYTLTIALPGSPAVAPFVAKLHVDSTPPLIVVSSPARGSAVASGDEADSPVTLTGSVTDGASALRDVSIAGTALRLAAGARADSFAVVQSSRWGVNVVRAEATDACGNLATLAQAYLRSPAFRPAVTVPFAGSRVSGAVVAHLDQALVDDGRRTSIASLAAVAEAAARTFDVNTAVAPGAVLVRSAPFRCTASTCMLVGTTGYETTYAVLRDPDPSHRIVFQGPFVDSVQLVAGGVRVSAHVTGVSFPFAANAQGHDCTLGCIGPTVSVSPVGVVTVDRVALTATVSLVAAPGGGVSADVPALSVQLGAASVAFTSGCGVLDSTCSAVATAAAGSASSSVQAALETMLRDRVAAALAQALGALGAPLTLELPPPLSVALTLAADVDALAFCGPDAGLPVPPRCTATPGSFAEASLAAQVFPRHRGEGIPATAPGPITHSAVEPSFAAGSGFGAALRDDLVNQLLWAVWYGGALDLPDVGAVAPPGVVPAGLSLSVRALLPPVLMPGVRPDELVVGVGDLVVHARADAAVLLGLPGAPEVDLTLYVTLVAGATIDVDLATSTIILAAETAPELAAQVVSAGDRGHDGEVSRAVQGALATFLPGVLKKAVAALPLPRVDLSAVPGVPAGTVWSVSAVGMGRAGGYSVVEGTLGP